MNRWGRGMGVGLLFVCSWGWGLSGKITYQGTLREKGVPASGSKAMIFRITDLNGTQVYWSSGQLSVVVSNGLFSVPLEPTGVSWEGITPYMEVSVEGQLLLPREPVTASVYSLLASAVTDGSISRQKLDSGVQDKLLPAGLIALFSKDCPTGWSRFGALDGLFPMGSPTYGATGGAATHAHVLAEEPAHTHGGSTAEPSDSASAFVFSSKQGGGSYQSSWGMSYHTHPIALDAAHAHGGTSGSESSLPPYLAVVFCQKQ